MDTPEPLIKGRFTLYETTDGGYHLAYMPDGEAESKHLEVPAWVVKMSKMAAEGKRNPLSIMMGMKSHDATV
jgi:hypothetical protein